jgi:ATP-binding cassette subfamily B protein
LRGGFSGKKAMRIYFEKVLEAAKKAKIADSIELMEHKYDTKVGERGIRLSGGQMQRIGIARALYKNAKIIIFDEATSALDNNTEKEVMNAIESLSDDLTIIIVAHRVSTLKNCDFIFELENNSMKLL